MVKLTSLLCEGLKLNPLTTFQQLRHAKVITCYHASENPNFEPYDHPLHVGSIQQSLDIVKHMSTQLGVDQKFYVYEMEVSLSDLANFLFDEDPIADGEIDPNMAQHNSYAYTNRIEHPQGLRQGTNISVVIMNPKEQIISQELVKVI